MGISVQGLGCHFGQDSQNGNIITISDHSANTPLLFSDFQTSWVEVSKGYFFSFLALQLAGDLQLKKEPSWLLKFCI
jgi:hypothetical protein